MPPHLRDTANDPATVAQLRRRRVTFEEIAGHLGISAIQAAELYRQALEEMPELAATEHRAEELMLADDAVRRLLTIARDDGTSPRTAVEAWNSARGWAEHKARLLGLDSAKASPQSTGSRLQQLRDARRA